MYVGCKKKNAKSAQHFTQLPMQAIFTTNFLTLKDDSVMTCVDVEFETLSTCTCRIQ